MLYDSNKRKSREGAATLNMSGCTIVSWECQEKFVEKSSTVKSSLEITIIALDPSTDFRVDFC